MREREGESVLATGHQDYSLSPLSMSDAKVKKSFSQEHAHPARVLSLMSEWRNAVWVLSLVSLQRYNHMVAYMSIGGTACIHLSSVITVQTY